MTDVSDPRGAGRRDRRHAVRLVDEAYASGRISAPDRALRLERVAAAATRGDLATVTRDLTVLQGTVTAPPAPSAPASSAPAPPEPAPTPSGEPPVAWAQHLDRRAAAPVPPPSRPWFRGPLGCVVVALVVLFLLPFVLSIVVFGIAFTSFDDLGPDGAPDGEGIVSTLGWEVMVDDLQTATGGAPVQVLTLEDGSAEAVVSIGSGVETWGYDTGGWARTGETRAAGVSRPSITLEDVDPFVLDELGGRAPVDWDGEDDNAMDPGTSVRIDASAGTPGIFVTTPDSGGAPQTLRHTLDGELVED